MLANRIKQETDFGPLQGIFLVLIRLFHCCDSVIHLPESKMQIGEVHSTDECGGPLLLQAFQKFLGLLAFSAKRQSGSEQDLALLRTRVLTRVGGIENLKFRYCFPKTSLRPESESHATSNGGQLRVFREDAAVLLFRFSKAAGMQQSLRVPNSNVG